MTEPEPRPLTEKVMLTVAEAAVLLSMSTPKCYELVARGVIPCVKLGPRCTRISRTALDEWAKGACHVGRA